MLDTKFGSQDTGIVYPAALLEINKRINERETIQIVERSVNDTHQIHGGPKKVHANQLADNFELIHVENRWPATLLESMLKHLYYAVILSKMYNEIFLYLINLGYGNISFPLIG